MPASRNVPEPCEGVTPARWQQVRNLLAQALEASPSDGPALLERICAGDPALRSEIESLLEARDRAGPGFLDNPAMVDLGGVSAEASWIDRRIGPYQIVNRLPVVDHCGASTKRSCASISTVPREYISGKYWPWSHSGSRSA